MLLISFPKAFGGFTHAGQTPLPREASSTLSHWPEANGEGVVGCIWMGKTFSDFSLKESVFGNLAHARLVVMQLTVRPAWILTPPTRMGVGYRLRMLTQFNCH